MTFFEDRAYSKEISKKLTSFYLSANSPFWGCRSVEEVEDLDIQRQGIDKILYFFDDRAILVEEKVRRKDYGDILIEVWSNWEKMKKGWIYTCKADYIVYFVEESGRIYILPRLLLQKAFEKHWTKWLEEAGGWLYSSNERYMSANIPVKVDALYAAIFEEMYTDIGNTYLY